MLRNTFLHIPGIGKKTELKFWKNGVHKWRDFLEGCDIPGLGTKKRKKVSNYLDKSLRSLEEEKFNFLIQNFPSKIHWRTYEELDKKNRCCFLDIETTGLSKEIHDITMIGIYNGSEEKIFIKGKNLDEFRSAVKDYDLFVTYNGKCFDIPFIQSKFPQLEMTKFHIDLRYVMKNLGYSGGLKSVEKQLGIQRSEEVEDTDGREAVILWKKYQRGDKKALKKLVDYNREDIVNLEEIMQFAYRKLRKERFVSKN